MEYCLFLFHGLKNQIEQNYRFLFFFAKDCSHLHISALNLAVRLHIYFKVIVTSYCYSTLAF